jgi:hypothetical protein
VKNDPRQRAQEICPFGVKICMPLPFLIESTFDDPVKSLKMLFSVIPVKTGIQSFEKLGWFWIPAYAGMTTFYETITFDGFVKSPSRRCASTSSLRRTRGGDS